MASRWRVRQLAAGRDDQKDPPTVRSSKVWKSLFNNLPFFKDLYLFLFFVHNCNHWNLCCALAGSGTKRSLRDHWVGEVPLFAAHGAPGTQCTDPVDHVDERCFKLDGRDRSWLSRPFFLKAGHFGSSCGRGTCSTAWDSLCRSLTCWKWSLVWFLDLTVLRCASTNQAFSSSQSRFMTRCIQVFEPSLRCHEGLAWEEISRHLCLFDYHLHDPMPVGNLKDSSQWDMFCFELIWLGLTCSEVW